MVMSNETLQGAIDMGQGIQATCNACDHQAVLDLVALRDRLGPEHGALHNDLVPLLVCSACGRRNASLTLIPAQLNAGGNSYSKAKGGGR